ncbi:hypothetical protein D3C72_2297240 [compost metagenome]
MRPNSFWKSATNFLFTALSRSCAHCEVLKVPSIDSPTARITSSSAEKPGAYRVMSLDRPAPTNCLMKFTPRPPGRKIYTPSTLAARILESSAP